METEELCSINISPLVTISFAAQWSPDNQISIITERGVHIFGLEPSPMSPSPVVKFARSFVYPTDVLPAYAFLNEIDSLIWNLEHEQLYSLLMEEAITPKLDSVNDTILRIVKVAWSPKNLISPSQCVLAILTAAGAIELLHKVSNEWYTICNMSHLWLNTVQDEIKSNLIKCKKSNRQYAIITESMRQLQACSMTWSELLEIDKVSFAFFSVAYRSGDISIWKVPRISDHTTILKPVLVGRINLNITVKVNVLCWVTFNVNEYLLLVGLFDGQIYGVKLKCEDNNLRIILIQRYIDPDHLTVNYLHLVNKVKSNMQILAVKGSSLLLLCINRTGILGSIQHLQVEGFNITGIAPIAAQQFLITTQDSHIFAIDTQFNNLISIDIKSHLPKTCVQYLGLAQSPNNVMFINITSPNTPYDHLVTREPSTVHVFISKGTKWDPLTIINNSVHLTKLWDCMEVIRVKANKAEDTSTVLCPMMKNFKSLSLYNLQVSLWMTVMNNVCKMKEQIPNMDHIKQSKISQALPLIFIHSACIYLDNVTKKSTLSEDQTLAISLLRRYIETYLLDKSNNEEDKNNIVYQRARKMLDATASFPTRIEKCNLCGETIKELSWNVTSCPSGHKLSRCTMTLLQITSLEYRVCPICGQVFHLSLEEVYEEPHCQFCDVPILCNTFALDMEESRLYGRNLSRLQVNNIVESSREQEEELSEKKKRKCSPSDVHSVTANNDDNELDKITETWQEF